MRQLAKQQSCWILMVTHNTQILEVADRLLRLKDGRLAENDLAGINGQRKLEATAPSRR